MDTAVKYLVGFPATNPYVDEWFLMKSTIPILLILFSYLAFVTKIGPCYMKNRKPYNLKTFIFVYNVFQVVFSVVQFVMAYEVVKPAGFVGITCNEPDDLKMKMHWFGYIYFLAKVLDLVDTILFVLRKKQNQVTFLHVYHHCAAMMVTWLTMKLEPVQAALFLPFVNAFVHAIMYTYYTLSAFPSLTPYLWWKKYITAMQMIQFALVIAQAMGNYFISECPPSYLLLYTIVLNEMLMVYLFGKFFIRSYLTPKKKAESEKAN